LWRCDTSALRDKTDGGRIAKVLTALAGNPLISQTVLLKCDYQLPRFRRGTAKDRFWADCGALTTKTALSLLEVNFRKSRSPFDQYPGFTSVNTLTTTAAIVREVGFWDTPWRTKLSYRCGMCGK
jgi:hypothetical protein